MGVDDNECLVVFDVYVGRATTSNCTVEGSTAIDIVK